MDDLYKMVNSPEYNIHLKTDPKLDELLHRLSHYYDEHFVMPIPLRKIRAVTLWSTGRWINNLISNCRQNRKFIRKMSRITNYIIAAHGGDAKTNEFYHPTAKWNSVGLTEDQGNALTFGFVVVRAACSSMDTVTATQYFIIKLVEKFPTHTEFGKFCCRYLALALRVSGGLKFMKEMELVYAIAATYNSDTYHNAIRDVSKEGFNLRLIWRTCKHCIRRRLFQEFNEYRWTTVIRSVIELLRCSHQLYNYDYNNIDKPIDRALYKVLLFVLASSRENKQLQ
ncbi:hypothetical protein CHUAL_010960 [Chamberlinius hualienensis]